MTAGPTALPVAVEPVAARYCLRMHAAAVAAEVAAEVAGIRLQHTVAALGCPVSPYWPHPVRRRQLRQELQLVPGLELERRPAQACKGRP